MKGHNTATMHILDRRSGHRAPEWSQTRATRLFSGLAVGWQSARREITVRQGMGCGDDGCPSISVSYWHRTYTGDGKMQPAEMTAMMSERVQPVAIHHQLHRADTGRVWGCGTSTAPKAQETSDIHRALYRLKRLRQRVSDSC